jgi:hypothetical protein
MALSYNNGNQYLSPLHNSIEPRHLTNKSQPRALWATGILLIVEYCIYHIIINTHVDDDVIKKNMKCPGGTPANDQTDALPHGVRLYRARGPGAHFGLISFFVAWFFAK